MSIEDFPRSDPLDKAKQKDHRLEALTNTALNLEQRVENLETLLQCAEEYEGRVYIPSSIPWKKELQRRKDFIESYAWMNGLSKKVRMSLAKNGFKNIDELHEYLESGCLLGNLRLMGDKAVKEVKEWLEIKKDEKNDFKQGES